MLKHGVDHVLIRDDQLFAYGWGFSAGTVVSKLTLRLHFEKKTDYLEIEANYGQRRDDVSKVFADIPEAVDAGFLILSDIGDKKIRRAELYWEFQDQAIIKTPVSLAQIHRPGQVANKIDQYWLLAKKSLILLRTAGLGALINKVRRYRNGKPITGDSVTWKNLADTLQKSPFSVVIDHDIGGGANTYRRAYIQERLAQNENVVLFGFHVASLQYFVELYQENSSTRYGIASIEAFLFLLGNANIQHIMYNCAVTFRQPLSVVKMLVTLRKHVHCELLVTIHDYFAICPSHFLMNDQGAFCNVPDLDTCQRCLTANKDSFVSFTGVRDIVRWRLAWSELLLTADEVRLFSNASETLLKRAYPRLDSSNWRVVPHVLHTPMQKVELPETEHLHIGVVGVIGKHKGAQIIVDLANEIIKRQSNIKITIIGSIEAHVPADVVDVTGPYDAKNLPEFVKNSGANLFLFPSIWAETFSYVAHELVAMNLPFACFDFGAPADLARSYERGIVLSTMNPEVMLSEIEHFWQEKIKPKKAVVWMNTAA